MIEWCAYSMMPLIYAGINVCLPVEGHVMNM